MDFLMLENMRHAGTENGNLLAPYDQLVDHGIGRRLIPEAVNEAERLGLIAVQRGGRKGWVPHHLSSVSAYVARDAPQR
jgi:hypothetical protein